LLRQNNAKKLKDGCKSIKACRACQLKKPSAAADGFFKIFTSLY